MRVLSRNLLRGRWTRLSLAALAVTVGAVFWRAPANREVSPGGNRSRATATDEGIAVAACRTRSLFVAEHPETAASGEVRLCQALGPAAPCPIHGVDCSECDRCDSRGWARWARFPGRCSRRANTSGTNEPSTFRATGSASMT